MSVPHPHKSLTSAGIRAGLDTPWRSLGLSQPRGPTRVLPLVDAVAVEVVDMTSLADLAARRMGVAPAPVCRAQ